MPVKCWKCGQVCKQDIDLLDDGSIYTCYICIPCKLIVSSRSQKTEVVNIEDLFEEKEMR